MGSELIGTAKFVTCSGIVSVVGTVLKLAILVTSLFVIHRVESDFLVLPRMCMQV